MTSCLDLCIGLILFRHLQDFRLSHLDFFLYFRHFDLDVDYFLYTCSFYKSENLRLQNQDFQSWKSLIGMRPVAVVSLWIYVSQTVTQARFKAHPGDSRRYIIVPRLFKEKRRDIVFGFPSPSVLTMYLVYATPPTVICQFFRNFTDVFVMV